MKKVFLNSLVLPLVLSGCVSISIVTLLNADGSGKRALQLSANDNVTTAKLTAMNKADDPRILKLLPSGLTFTDKTYEKKESGKTTYIEAYRFPAFDLLGPIDMGFLGSGRVTASVSITSCGDKQIMTYQETWKYDTPEVASFVGFNTVQFPGKIMSSNASAIDDTRNAATWYFSSDNYQLLMNADVE